MSTIRKLALASLPPAQRALAHKLSHDDLIGDPDVDTLSEVEVQRAWADASRFTSRERAVLAELSALLGVTSPHDAPIKTKADRLSEVLGPPRVNTATGKIERYTRIVATLGPASRDIDTVAAMIEAGMDVARVNFSHIKGPDDARDLIETIRAAMDLAGRGVKILADLPGPKIRLSRIDAPIELSTGATIELGPPGFDHGRRDFVPVDPAEVLRDLQVNDRVFIDDGKLALKVTSIDHGKVMARVIKGGSAKSRKGINLPDTRLSERVPTDDDRLLIDIAKGLGVKLFAASFIEDGDDMARFRAAVGHDADIVAKVERPAALQHLDAIYAEADAIMVARGDLAVELGDAETPVAQAVMHNLGNQRGVPTGTATQMLESMTGEVRPTRAEASDVYRSVVEGAEFVMTSGETAVGDDPVAVLRQMSKLIETSELAIRTGTVCGAT
jgi:pyruvate kinase